MSNKMVTNIVQFQPYDFRDKIKNVTNYVERMYNRTAQMFIYEGLPDTIPQNMLELYIQNDGIAIVKEVEGKLYVIQGAPGGKCDGYYRPDTFIVANPWLNISGEYKLGEECVLVYNDSQYMGLKDMYRRYATQLVENDISINIADIMARCTAIITAGDDRSKASAELFLKRIKDGDLSVIGDNSIIEAVKTLPFTGTANQTITDLIELQQYIKASWFNELGLNANYNMKRESINSNEAQLNEDALIPLIDDMLHCREKFCDEINKLYGTHIKVHFHSVWEKKEEELEGVEVEELEPIPNAEDVVEEVKTEEVQDDRQED